MQNLSEIYWRPPVLGSETSFELEQILNKKAQEVEHYFNAILRLSTLFRNLESNKTRLILAPEYVCFEQYQWAETVREWRKILLDLVSQT